MADLTACNGPLRLLVNGHVVRGAGSTVGGMHLVLEELLKRGHGVRFVSKRSYVYPADLVDRFERFRFVDATNRGTDALHERVGSRLGPMRYATGVLNHRAFGRTVMRKMRAEHAREPADLVLFLNTPAFGRVAGLPGVSWVQGAPGTDVRSLGRQSALLKQTEGWLRWTGLRAYGWYRMRWGLPDYSASDRLIASSRVSAGLLDRWFGQGPEKVRVIPVPMDLSRFTMRDRSPGGAEGGLSVLWLGRIVPRKRLDLLLDGLRLAAQQGVGVRAKVVGGFSFAPGLKELVERFDRPELLDYSPEVPREEVMGLIKVCDVLVQPSEEEDFGASVAEALACGTPVMTGPSNGTGEYQCERSIRLADYEPATLAEAFAACEKRKRAGTLLDPQHTRSVAERNFAVGPIVDRLEEVLYSLC
ncbi:MAG: glycosyltransferase [Planctomycetota bacterium]